MTAPYIPPRVDPDVARSVGGRGFIDTLMALAAGAPESIDLESSNRGAYLPVKNWMFLTPQEVDMGDYGLAGFSQEAMRGTLTHEFGHLADEKHKLNSAGGDPEAFADAFGLAVKNRVGGESMGSNYEVRQYRNKISNRQAHVADSLVRANLNNVPYAVGRYDDRATAAAREHGVPVHLAVAITRVGNGGPADAAILRKHYDRLGSWEKALRAYSGTLDDPTKGDAFVNQVRNALSAQIGRPAPSPISTAARDWLDRLALARHVLENKRIPEADRQRVVKQFHDTPVPQ